NSNIIAEIARPKDRDPAISLIHPQAAGPMVWPIANRLVAIAMALPQAGRARLLLTKPVTADGTMKTLAPTRTAESQIPTRSGNIKGKAAPAVSTSNAEPIGLPSWRPLNRRAQIRGASNVMTPNSPHMTEVVAASRVVSVA